MRAALAVLAVAVLAVSAGCGDDPKPTDKGLRTAAQKFYDAITRGDGDAACDLMTKKLRGAVDRYGRATRVQCGVAIERFVPSEAKIVSVTRDGKSGSVRVKAPDAKSKSKTKDPLALRGGSATATLKFTGGKWRVDNPGTFAPG